MTVSLRRSSFYFFEYPVKAFRIIVFRKLENLKVYCVKLRSFSRYRLFRMNRYFCSGQQIPDTDLSRFSVSIGDSPSLT